MSHDRDYQGQTRTYAGCDLAKYWNVNHKMLIKECVVVLTIGQQF